MEMHSEYEKVEHTYAQKVKNIVKGYNCSIKLKRVNIILLSSV